MKEKRVKTAAMADAVGAARASMYEKIQKGSPVPVVSGGSDHPLSEMGGGFFPRGAPWALRKMHPKEELPKDPFIFAPGQDQRIQGKSRLLGDVDASSEAVLAHEVGHAADRARGGLGKLLQSSRTRMVGTGLGLAGGLAGGAAARFALDDKPEIGIPLSALIGAAGFGLGQAPTLLSEGRATEEGLKRLQGAGATAEELEQYKKELAGAMGTYKRGALLSSAVVGAATPLLAKYSEAKPKGFYKGQPVSPHTVKFKMEYQGIPINVDRPRGFIMKGTDAKGRDWARRYKCNYGFIPKTLGGDGDGLDVFIGPLKKEKYAYWAVQRKDDGSFDEYKVFLGFPDRDAAVAAYRQHIPKKYFKGIITMKVEMMKAMLGKVNPDEKMKRASALAMVDELGWLMGTSA